MLHSLITLYQAKVARMLGDEIGAEALLGQARRCYAEPDAAVRQTFGEEAVAQALRFDPSKAAPLIAELDQDRVGTQVLRVRLALVDHDDRAAAALLADLPPATTRRTRVERGVLCALSVLARDVERANGHLREALDAGQPERLIRTVVDQAPGVHHLLLSCTPAASQERYVEDLLAATSRILPPARADVAPALVEPLSPREVIVLRYLCSRLTYREIAAALYVSLNTLKSHVRSMYRKLAVASRADAVDVGRCRRSDLIALVTSPSPPRSRRPMFIASGEELGLLLLELGVGDDALRLQVGELGSARRRSRRRCRRRLGRRSGTAPPGPGLGDVTFAHLVAAGDEVDEHAEERHDDHEDRPQRLAHAAQVAAAEDVGDHPEQQHDPGDPQEPDHHRPEHAEQRIVVTKHGHLL